MDENASAAEVAKRNGWRPRFSLRTLLAAVTLLAVASAAIGWRVVSPARTQRHAVLLVERLGGSVEYEGPEAGESRFIERLRRRLPRDYFDSVLTVSLSPTSASDEDVACLAGLPRVRKLQLGGTRVTDQGIASLRGLTDLRKLYLEGTRVSDTGLDHLHGMTQLQELSLGGTNITDAGLSKLRHLEQLESLWIDNTAVTEAGAAELQRSLPKCIVRFGN